MKFIKWSFIILLLFLFGCIAAVFIYLQSSRPVYHGERYVNGITENVKIYFDNYGIPHIVAANSKDAYFALGYAQAQERLFQMELLRRVGSGRLSEILGEELIPVDAFFRTIGITKSTKEAVSMHFNNPRNEWQQNTLDFIDGINAFIANGPTPPEFLLLNIPKAKFTPEDIYNITGYMSFSFAEALRTDPILDKLVNKLSPEYLEALNLEGPEVSKPDSTKSDLTYISDLVNQVFNKLPMGPWIGSNAWVIAPEKSTSGKVLFANDTHIGYQQPAVWFEAHINYPGLNLYGNYLPGLPFPLVGHNKHISWGLTMFENDDMNLYREKSDGNFPGMYKYKGQWKNFQLKKETIKVKNKADTIINIRESIHGPIINDVVSQLDSSEYSPIALWWTYTRLPPTALVVTYELSHAKEINAARKAASMVNAPGLNIVYGDIAGNIAIWAAAKLPVYKKDINTKIILDGSSGNDDVISYHDFRFNPQSENPASGYIYSANQNLNQRDSILIPGYYAPIDRANKIKELLNSKEKWSLKDFESINLNITSDVQKNNAQFLFLLIEKLPIIKKAKFYENAALELKNWNGNHGVNDIAPTIYYKFLANIFEMAMKDELGEDDFKTLVNTHLMKNSYHFFISNENNKWWNDISTDSIKESRSDILEKAYAKTIGDLHNTLGDLSNWTWGGIHTVEHIHPIGRKKPLDKIFNVGPFPVGGGIETINNASFALNSEGLFDVTYGPAMRILIDFANIENGKSVLPTGQSGHTRSPYYQDQSILHINGRFRPMKMNKQQIIKDCINIFTLRPN